MASANAPSPKSGIDAIAAYVPGRSKASGTKTLHKLSSNESPLGASPNAIDAFKDASEHLELYPDGSAAPLREAIAAHYGLNPDHIVCGAGSDELLALLSQAYLGAGDEAIYSKHGFLMYEIAIRANSATPGVADETDLTSNVDAILSKVSAKTKMVFLANPNNPTGTYLPFSEVKRLHEGLPENCILVLDAAYAEYVRKNDYESGIELVATTRNVVMTRTFSKIHGLAALRLGWAYCPPAIADVLNRIRGPFNVTAPSIAAGAASIEDAEFIERAIAHNNEWLPWLTAELEKIGLRVTPSVGNFILINFPRDGMAQAADEYLLERGIVLRQVGNYHLPNALRMSVGTQDANEMTVAALAAFLKEQEK
ncbi:MAG: histidinol-phosphate transaminase [Hyphomicrobiales bacterium]